MSRIHRHPLTEPSSLPRVKTREKWLLAGIVLAALCIRLALIFFLSTYRISSEQEHWGFGFESGRIAQSLAAGRGFSSPFQKPTGPTAWLAPIYPLLLAVIFKGFGTYSPASAVVALGLNSLLSALTCIGLYRLGRVLFGPTVAWLSAGGFALYPPSIWHAINTIWDTTLFVFALVFLMDYLYRLPPHPSRRQYGIIGGWMGLLLLINPAALPFYPFLLLWLWRRNREPWREKITEVCIMLALALAAVLPWMLRNERVLGRFILKSNVGLELKRGNNLAAWQTRRTRDWEQVHPSVSPEEFRRYAEMTEIPYLDRCEEEALRFIRENPGKFLQLVLRRVAYFWLGELREENEWTGNVQVGGRLTWMKRINYWAPLPPFLFGLALAWRRGRPIGLLVSLFLSFPLAYYITHVTNRYRYPIEPFMLLLATYGLWTWMRNMVKRRA